MKYLIIHLTVMNPPSFRDAAECGYSKESQFKQTIQGVLSVCADSGNSIIEDEKGNIIFAGNLKNITINKITE